MCNVMSVESLKEGLQSKWWKFWEAQNTQDTTVVQTI